MNCPNCGAQNDADALFCAECGTPLENPDMEETIVGRVFLRNEPEPTAVTEPEDPAAEAKTVAFDQAQVAEQVANTETEMMDKPTPPTPPPSPSSPVEIDPTEDPPPGSNQGGSGSFDGGDLLPPVDEGDKSNRTKIIIAVVAVLFLACCCCLVPAVVGSMIGSDPGAFEDLLDEFSQLAIYLPIV